MNEPNPPAVASEPAEPTTRPMPFDLWWSPSLRRFLARHESQDDEHLVWVFHGHHEALRHYLGTGPDSNPPLPADAVRLVLADPAQTTELARRLDETQQKLAEADRLYADLLAQREQWWEHVGRERAQLEAERDERQTRIDRVETLCREWEANPASDWTAGDAAEAARGALAGDQPTAHALIEERDDAAGDLP